MLNLAGAIIYLLVAMAALSAWISGMRAGAARGRQRRQWLWIALAFVALAAWRLGQGEALLQEWARGLAQSDGVYESRRAVQAPVIAFAVLAGGLGLLYLAMAGAVPRWLRCARAATLALLGFSVVRAISFHPVDAMIYAGLGPLHVNHLIDMGLAVFAAGCGVAQWRSNACGAAKSGLND